MKLPFRKTKKTTIADVVLSRDDALIPEIGHARNLMIKALHLRPLPSDFRRAIHNAQSTPSILDNVLGKMNAISSPIWIEGEPYPGKRFGIILAIEPNGDPDIVHISGWAEVNKHLFFIPLLAKWVKNANSEAKAYSNSLKSAVYAHTKIQDTPGTKQLRRIMSQDDGFDDINLGDFFGNIMRDCVLFGAAALADDKVFVVT